MTGFDDIEYAGRTDVGVRRSHNQDAHVLVPATDAAQWHQRGHFFIVADGMGGHAVGELASKMAVDNIPHIYSKHAGEGAQVALRKAFIEANCTINNRGSQNREFRGMGTTGIALVLRPEGAWVANVGDSRIYRVRAGVIEQLTFDHSWVWELARRQNKRPEEMTGIGVNRITRSLGPEPLVQVDVDGPYPLQPGDAFLLCSDGLTGQVNDREIGAVVSALSPDEACEFLIHLANLQGGPDNTTVLVIRVGGEAPTDAERPDAPAMSRGRAMLRWAMPILKRVPWAFVSLGTGILLAILAIFLTWTHAPSGFPVFVFAGLALFAGLLSLMVQNFRETRRPPPAPVRVAPIYRRASCAIDAALLQKLTGATRALEDNIHEKGWQLDEAPYQAHIRNAAHAAEAGQPREAFPEQCRALSVLMAAVHHQRGREESFKPLWDKPAVG